MDCQFSDKVAHLVDDRRMGGVTRFLGCLAALRPCDEVFHVQRHSMRARKYSAATIVSHLAISWRSLPMLIALRACNPSARLIHVEHSYSAGFEEHRVPNKKRFHTLLRTVYALFDQVVCVSKGQAGWMHSIGVAPESKTVVATPLVDLAPFLAIAPAKPSKTIRYGFVGRLDEQKGLDVVIEAWKLIAPKNATLEIFGDGPKREALEAQAYDTSNVTFHGRTDDPAEAYEAIDVAILPSRWEPYGLSCVEARAAGRPVIVSDVDGLPEQVTQEGGMVVDRSLAPWVKLFAHPPEKTWDAVRAEQAKQNARDENAKAVSVWNALLDGESVTNDAPQAALVS